MGLRKYNFDAEMVLKDAGLVASSAAATVGGNAKIIDLGAARIDAVAVIDASAIEIDSNNELFTIIIQGSKSSSFASDIENLASIALGATEVRPGGAADSLAGRYELPFTNEQNDTTYRYLRAYTVVAGTQAAGINYTAFVAPLQGR